MLALRFDSLAIETIQSCLQVKVVLEHFKLLLINGLAVKIVRQTAQLWLEVAADGKADVFVRVQL